MRPLYSSASPIRLTTFLATVGVALLATTAAAPAQAQIIERTAFTGSALTETFTGLGLPTSSVGSLNVDGIGFTFSGNSYRYNDFGSFSTGEALATNSDTGSVLIVFNSVFQRVGLDVGGSTGTVEFFDAENFLLNQQNVANTALTTSDFVGFQSAGGIKSIRVTDTAANGLIQAYDNLSRENVSVQTAAPEPGSLALLLPLVGMVGIVTRKRRSQK